MAVHDESGARLEVHMGSVYLIGEDVGGRDRWGERYLYGDLTILLSHQLGGGGSRFWLEEK